MRLAPSIFLLFLALVYASYSTQFLSPRMLTTSYVTKSGNVSLNSAGNGYYLNIDLAYHYNDASEDENFDHSMVRMSLGLYTSQTVLTSQSCMGWYNYDCSTYNCTPDNSSSSTPVFPAFEVLKGSYIEAEAYLDYTYWQLNTDATLTTSCNSSIAFNYGSGTYGIVGLGRNGTEANFLASSPIFSVYLDPFFYKSTLLFRSNENITTISDLIGTLSTNADWNILPSPIQVSFYNYQATLSLGALFDLNFNGIGVPLTLFNTIVQTLQSTGIVNCGNSTNVPYCYLYRSNDDNSVDLPTLKLTIHDQEIDIPPEIYASGYFKSTGNVQFTLNFRAIDPSTQGAYQNYIIFDSHFMTYYYTEFSYLNDSYTITLYKPNFDDESGDVIWPFILGGVLGFIIIVGLIVFWIRKRRNNRIKDKDQADKKSNGNAVDEASSALLANSEGREYNKPDYTAGKYGYESWISPDVPQSS